MLTVVLILVRFSEYQYDFEMGVAILRDAALLDMLELQVDELIISDQIGTLERSIGQARNRKHDSPSPKTKCRCCKRFEI